MASFSLTLITSAMFFRVICGRACRSERKQTCSFNVACLDYVTPTGQFVKNSESESEVRKLTDEYFPNFSVRLKSEKLEQG